MHSLNKGGKIDKLSEAVLPIGQIIFLNGYGQSVHHHERLAIYEVVESDFDGRLQYKYVNLDKPARGQKSAYEIRHISKLFGIGIYYQDNEMATHDEIVNALADAMEAERIEAVQKEAARVAADEHRKYLSQFERADRRKTTILVKKHILTTWPSVSKVEVRTEVYTGGDSMRVKYYAPAELEDLERWVKSFQYGRFNGMEDIYENNDNQQEIIIEGHILEQYKYVFVDHAQSDVVREVKEQKQAPAAEAVTGNFELVDYSERAVAVFGDTKTIKDKLAALGGRFNKFLTHNGVKKAGWIFSKSKAEQLKNLLK